MQHCCNYTCNYIANQKKKNQEDTMAQSTKYVVGVCCMDSKARSKPMRNILNSLIQTGLFECVVFGDKAILDEDVADWPNCDFLISLFSTGFPLMKAIDYVRLRAPFLVNDLGTQEILWDRRLVLYLLDSVGVPTPRRLNTYTGEEPPLSASLVQKLRELNLPLPVFPQRPVTGELVDHDTLKIGNEIIRKPFVEKPISGEDHNIYIYYPKSQGGGVRKLFRKIGNKSSEFYADVSEIRQGSYIYEEFMDVDNAEDVKVYTLGTRHCHAETRKSPVVDGVVRRNAEGKEVRYVAELTPDEVEIAKLVSTAFRQTVCGFDLLRVNGKSYVIDVNGWSFVKGNADYYEKCATVLKEMFFENIENNPTQRQYLGGKDITVENQWRLKGFLSVMRHGDRTPKQKCKFNFKSDIFISLLNGGTEEIQLKSESQLLKIVETCQRALEMECEKPESLNQLIEILGAKSKLPGTKAQIKPVFDSEDPKKLKKVQLIVKWGGEFTHGGLHQTKDFAENLRKDLLIINRKVLDHIKVYSSSERRVIATADIFLKTFLCTDSKFDVNKMITVSKEMLDDSNAAKKQIEQVKTKFQALFDPSNANPLPNAFNIPEGTEPSKVIDKILGAMTRIRENFRTNFKDEEVMKGFDSNSNRRWCCGETLGLFRERWEKIFKDFCDVNRSSFEPSKISELYDSLKYDLLHNRDLIESVFGNNATKSNEDLQELYSNAKVLFFIIAPNEYGISDEEKMEIGILSAQTLLKQLISDMKLARDNKEPSAFFYFTKESKVVSLMNIVLACGLADKIQKIEELDYLTQIVFELYERKSNNNEHDNDEYSLRLSFSQGGHTSDLLAIQLDAKHSISVQPRRWASDHIPLKEVFNRIEKNFSIIKHA